MNTIFEITPSDIDKLDEEQCVRLLKKLLYCEVKEFDIKNSYISVPFNIKSKDDGKDGTYINKEYSNNTEYLPNNYVVFQCKSGKTNTMPPSECKNEIIKKSKGKKELKPALKEMAENKGCYILFITYSLTETLINKRIKSFEEGFNDFNYDVKVKIYDSNKIAEWVNNYCSAIIQIKNMLDHSLLSYFQDFEDWKGEKDFQNKYVISDKNKKIISEIRELIKKEKQIIRITGLSGIGKTRTVFEVFNSHPDPEKFKNLLIYTKATSQNLVDYIHNIRYSECSGIIVVDNCDYEIITQLKNEIEHRDSHLTLICIDSDPESGPHNIKTFRINPISDDLIKDILNKKYKNHKVKVEEYTLTKLAKFASGFPSLAIMLTEAKIQNAEDLGTISDSEIEDLGTISDSEIVDKLIFGYISKGKSNICNVRNILKACAIFEYFGFTDEVENQKNFIKEHLCSNIDAEEFECELKRLYEKRNLFEKKGRYLSLTPQPLRVTLALEWWEGQSINKLTEIFNTIQEKYPELIEPLCSQMSKLHFYEKTKKFVENMCGEQAPFGKLEVLNTELGSRLFQYFIEVDPRVTMNTLNRIFLKLDNCELKKVLKTRRNIIFSLEKLVFFEETFYDAVKLLFKFAEVETEPYGNNSTNIFTNLYYIYLPNTEVNLVKRLDLLKELITKNKKEIDLKIFLLAFKKALNSRNFQNIAINFSGRIEDSYGYKPKTYKEIFEYWKQMFILLEQFVYKKEKISKEAKNIILNSIYAFSNEYLFEFYLKKIEEIYEKNHRNWPEAYIKLNDYKTGKESSMPENALKKLKQLLEKIKPHDIRDMLFSVVSIPSLNNYKRENNEIKIIALEETKELASKCAKKSMFPSFLDNIDVLFEGKQKMGFLFGEELSKKLNKNQAKKFIEKFFSMIENKKIDDLNLDVFLGFTLKIHKDTGLRTIIIKQIINNEILLKNITKIITKIEPSYDELILFLSKINNSTNNIEYLSSLSTGGNLRRLTSKELFNFFK